MRPAKLARREQQEDLPRDQELHGKGWEVQQDLLALPEVGAVARGFFILGPRKTTWRRRRC